VPLVHATVFIEEPVPLKQVNPVQGAATVLPKQLSAFEQHPTIVVVDVVAVYDAVHVAVAEHE
jgi:hypothetical protein